MCWLRLEKPWISYGLFLVEGESNLNSYRDYDGDIERSQYQIYSPILDWYERIGLPLGAAHPSPVVLSLEERA